MISAPIKKLFFRQTDADRQTDGKTHRHRSSNSSLDLRFEKKRKIHTKYLRFKNMQEKLERKGTFSVALQIHFRQKKTRIPT